MDSSKPLEVIETAQGSALNLNVLATAKGGGIVLVGKVFTYATRFIITFLLARILGAEQYGAYNLALSAATIAGSMALVGLDTALLRYIALWRSRSDEAGVWGAIQIGLGFTLLFSVLSGAGLFALSYWLASEVFHAPELTPYLQVSAALVPFLTLSDTLAGATRGFKNMHYMVIAQNFVQPIVRVVLIVIFAIVGLNIIAALLIFGIADFSASLLLLYFLNKQFPLRRPIATGRRDVRAIFGFSLPIWLSESMVRFRSSIQTILLGSLNTVTTVGIFAVANQLNLVAELVHTSVTTAVTPILVEVHDQGQRHQLERLYQTISKWTFAFNLPVFLIVVLFPSEILSLFGAAFKEGATALTILAWASLVNAATGMCGTVLDFTGYVKLKLVNSVLRLALMMALNVWLIPIWGMVGAAVAVLAGELFLNVLRVVEVYVLLRILPYNWSSLGPIVSGIAALLITLGVGQLLVDVNVLVRMGVQSIVLLCVYVALIGRLGLAAEDHVVLSHVRRRAGKRFGRLVPGFGKV